MSPVGWGWLAASFRHVVGNVELQAGLELDVKAVFLSEEGRMGAGRSLGGLAVPFEAACAAPVFALVNPNPSADCVLLRLFHLDFTLLGCEIS